MAEMLITCTTRFLDQRGSQDQIRNLQSMGSALSEPIVVIGAGIVGVSAAYHLLTAGARNATLIDRVEPGEAPQGPVRDSSRNGAQPITTSDQAGHSYRITLSSSIAVWMPTAPTSVSVATATWSWR